MNSVALMLDDDRGDLRAGQLADIIAFDGNPLEDISALRIRDRTDAL